MAYCGNCGSRVNDGIKFCPSCGSPMPASDPRQPPQQPQQAQPTGEKSDFAEKFSQLNKTADTTGAYRPNDIANNKAMSILAYIGPLCFIPLFAARDSKFARFHTNQGLLLFIACVIWTVAYNILSAIILMISWRLYFLISLIGLVSLVFLVLAIIGIINAANGRAKELPIIGKFRLLK